MNWMWLVGGGTGALLAVLALHFFGLGGVLRVVRAVFDALGDAAAAVRDWLRNPGNKTRGIAGVCALGFAVAGLQSWQRGTVIVQQRADYVRLQQDRAADRTAYERDLGARDKAIAHFVRLAEEQLRLLEIAQQQAADALADAAKARAQALASEARWQEQYEQRPPECQAALQVMAKACPTLAEY